MEPLIVYAWWAGLLRHPWSVDLQSKALAFYAPFYVIRGYLWWLMVILLLSRALQLEFLRVVFGLLYCLICTFVILINNFYSVICFEYADDSSLVKVIERKEDRLESCSFLRWSVELKFSTS